MRLWTRPLAACIALIGAAAMTVSCTDATQQRPIPPAGSSTPAVTTPPVTGDRTPPAVTGTPRYPTRPGGYAEVQVFYATNRQPFLGAAGGGYGPYRDTGGIKLGHAVVTIPACHTPGWVEEPGWFAATFTGSDVRKHFVLQAVTPLGPAEFWSQLRGLTSASPARSVFVFVHGYNVSFKDALLRTAQMAYDLPESAGVPIAFSWPSASALLGYVADINSAEWSADDLELFLEQVARQSGAQTVNIIAHSMGNLSLIRALQGLQRSGTGTRGSPMFNQVVLAAPDIDADLFTRMAARLQGVANGVTLYASDHDEALAAAMRLASYPRAGDSRTRLISVPMVDSIDASAVDTDFLGHSYYGSPALLGDIAQLFATGAKPAQRPSSVESAVRDGIPTWRVRKPEIRAAAPPC